MTLLLETRGLRYSYPGGARAIDDISFKLEDGSKLSLIGANGSGKSTLLLHLAGCLTPTGGEILLNGHVTGQNLQALRNAAGLVFQEPDDQLFMPSVIEDVAFALTARKIKIGPAKAEALECLKNLGVSHLADRPPHRLSCGEKRMVALAGILVMKPSILLLDEPSAALDPKARRSVVNILKTLDKPMIIATHDLDMARSVCDRAVILQNGRLAADGTPDELLQDEKALERYGL
jgi:cobalt/nickel transport system ATP-binding protein